MSNARIDFEGQYGIGCFAQQSIQVSRTQPAILNEHISTFAWNQFCDKIDQELHPMNKIRKVAGLMSCTCFAVFIIAPLATMISTFASTDPFSGRQPNIIAFILGPLIAMVGLIATQVIAMKKANQVIEGVKRVCDEVSKQQPRLSFHVRFERHYYHRQHDNRTGSHTTNYIEVIVAGGGAVPLGTADMSALPYATNVTSNLGVPVVTSSVAVPDRSPAERLANLEEMKPHLSEQEYAAKRNDILNSV
uniref:Uncharacterized protein n=1 Tax=Trieres chinensis TaxID=1514140 RepID=A0A7S2E7T8_TRICV|mmetsp:Transcript_11352/g.23807  ORF Transcript_11352/g.23807 Transcript_11352/m.23807 type:complete len:248 (+) Transcript_11352:278-1021(+)